MVNKNVVIFKNITSGFMDLEKINYLADIFEKNKNLRENLVFILDNNSTNEANHALMQMYNTFIGFDIFIAAITNDSILEYKHLNQLELRKEISASKINFDEFLRKKYNNSKIKTYIIIDNIYKSLLSIIKEIL